MKSIKLVLFLLLTIATLFGCGTESGKVHVGEDLTDVQLEESKAEEIKEESSLETEEKQEQANAENIIITETSSNLPSDINTIDAKVESVVDGDTIKVYINGQVESVRFLLVDTPETNHPRLGKQPFGDEAKEFTRKMVEGKTVQLEKDVSERDKYGRLLYYVYVDGKSVQEELLRNGLARVAYVYVPNTKYVDRYYEIQKEAQQKGVGIWSIENYAQEDGFHKEVVEEDNLLNLNGSENVNNETTSGFSGDCNIKGNISSSGEKIYHMPGQQYYDRTKIDPSKGEKYFCSREEAEKAGFRPSQR